MKRTIRGLRLLLCAALAAGLLAVPARAVVPSSSTLAPYAASKTYLVNCSGLNLRYAASVTSEVQFVLPRGATVTYLSDKSGWWYVSYRKNSTTYYGWVDKKYLAPAFTGASVGRYAVTASQLNVRSYPRLSARRVGGLARGTVINISELNGDWGYSATVGGWVALQYLTPVAGSGQAAASVTAGSTYRVVATRLNVRSGASTSDGIKDVIDNGTSVTVTRVSGGWAYVTYRGGEGWVSTGYLG